MSAMSKQYKQLGVRVKKQHYIKWKLTSTPHLRRTCGRHVTRRSVRRQRRRELSFAAHSSPWPRSSFKNAEIFTLTYGALVMQLIKDYEDYGEVNKQLDKMSVLDLSRASLRETFTRKLS